MEASTLLRIHTHHIGLSGEENPSINKPCQPQWATSPNSQNTSTILNSALKRPTPINAVVLAENTAVDPPTGRRYLAAAGNYRVKIAPACGRSPIAYSQWPYSSLCWFNFC